MFESKVGTAWNGIVSICGVEGDASVTAGVWRLGIPVNQ